jgi:transcriptional regulator with XRE-family HTH domain
MGRAPKISSLKDRNDDDRRKELADFLKTRRARVKPPQNSYFQFNRRRTPGLRREEVAEMAGVSSAWYTWLEQGRNIRPSSELLSRLSEVFKLSPFETNHLFDLAEKTSVEDPALTHEEIPDAVRAFVTQMISVPAFILGERYDFLAWNHHLSEQLLDLEAFPKEKRNWLEILFMKDSSFRDLPEWAEVAQRTVAEFRWSVGKHVGRPWVRELVNRMCKESDDFAKLWRQHHLEENNSSRVLEASTGKKGKQSFIRSQYIPAEAEHLRVIVLAPIESKNRKKLKSI